MSSLLTRLGMRFEWRFAPVASVAGPRFARKGARAAVTCGIATFVLATAGLVVSLETTRPELRDPEFGLRIRQIQKLKAEAPDRPLVLVLGSSRVQMGISPAAMGLPGGPTDPLVYNFGMIGARPWMVLLNLLRIREAGIEPRAALIEFMPLFLSRFRPMEWDLLGWSDRLSHDDFRQIAPYAGDLSEVRRRWAVSRLSAWSSFRLRLLSTWAPDWIPDAVREDGGGDRLDPYGFVPHRLEAFDPAILARVRATIFRRRPPPKVTEEADRSIRDLIALCRAEGMELAFFCPPESPTFRRSYGPGEREVAEEYAQKLSREERVDIFLAPNHFLEEEFLDGHHLLKPGAEKYSRWLADTHLKPWFIREGVSR